MLGETVFQKVSELKGACWGKGVGKETNLTFSSEAHNIQIHYENVNESAWAFQVKLSARITSLLDWINIITVMSIVLICIKRTFKFLDIRDQVVNVYQIKRKSSARITFPIFKIIVLKNG